MPESVIYILEVNSHTSELRDNLDLPVELTHYYHPEWEALNVLNHGFRVYTAAMTPTEGRRFKKTFLCSIWRLCVLWYDLISVSPLIKTKL